MYHTIEFVVDFTMDLEVSPRRPLELLLTRKGTRRKAQIRPYVVGTEGGLIALADLFFEDGTTARRVRSGWFSLVGEPVGVGGAT